MFILKRKKSPFSRLESIIMLLYFSCFRKLKIFQMDIKLDFLNGDLEKEVRFEKLEGFQLSKNECHV